MKRERGSESPKEAGGGRRPSEMLKGILGNRLQPKERTGEVPLHERTHGWVNREELPLPEHANWSDVFNAGKVATERPSERARYGPIARLRDRREIRSTYRVEKGAKPRIPESGEESDIW